MIGCLGFVMTACMGDGGDEPVPPSSGATAPARGAGWADLDVVPCERGAVTTAAPEGAAMRPLEARSREELAQALRPVLLRDDGVFVMREPNWAAADAVRAGSAVAVDAPASPSSPELLRHRTGDDLAVPPDELRSVSRVLGADGRTRVLNTAVAPHSATARVLITFDNGDTWQCTGTYVGPWTFILAAHCLRQPTGAVARRMVFEPARNGAALPFGYFDCRNDDAAANNDFLAAIPAAYASSEDPAFDFGVIDTFPCHWAPRWLGQPATNQGVLVNPGDTTYAMNGYPVDPCPGAPGSNLYNCGMSGPASS